MAYIIKMTYGWQTDYIANGRNYIVNHESYVPLTSRLKDAKLYKSKALAKRGCDRKGCNLIGELEIVEVEI